MKATFAVVGLTLAIGGIALSAYLKWTNVDATPLRLFLTHPLPCLASTFAIGIGGAFLKAASK